MAALYTVRVVAYQVMSNHIHLLLQAPAEPPSEEETIRRYEDFHHGKRQLTLRPGSRSCREWQARLRDVSWCMRHLQHLSFAGHALDKLAHTLDKAAQPRHPIAPGLPAANTLNNRARLFRYFSVPCVPPCVRSFRQAQ